MSDGHGTHVMPVKILAGIWGSLLVLTIVTVAAAGVRLPHIAHIGIWIAMGIATVKATLVAMYFMHLRYEKPFHAIVFVSAVLFVLLFVGFALTDTQAYQSDLIPGYGPHAGSK